MLVPIISYVFHLSAEEEREPYIETMVFMSVSCEAGLITFFVFDDYVS
jgi:hypothetical protein